MINTILIYYFVKQNKIMTEFMCFILFANRFQNKVLNRIKRLILFLNVVIVFYSVEKRFYSVENLVQKPVVGEQDKTHEFSL